MSKMDTFPQFDSLDTGWPFNQWYVEEMLNKWRYLSIFTKGELINLQQKSQQTSSSAGDKGYHERGDTSASAAAKSLQSCLTLYDPKEGSPPGYPVPGILQARTLEWVAISFSNAWKWKMKVKLLSCVRFFTTPWTAAYKAPSFMGFSRQEYWRGVPLPSPYWLFLNSNLALIDITLLPCKTFIPWPQVYIIIKVKEGLFLLRKIIT